MSDAILDLVRIHAAFASAIAFLLAFSESLALISLLLPATMLLVGGGGIFSAAGLGFWPVWIAAVLGAVMGDWLSYWIGFHYRNSISQVWPLSRAVAEKPGILREMGCFRDLLGRFFGPLRCVMPLIAGTCAMRQIPFQTANLASALLLVHNGACPRPARGWGFP